MFRHVLVPIDGSDASLRVVERAAEFAKKQRARLSTFDTALFNGSAADAILEHVGASGADLVIMAHNVVAEAVIRRSPVPVILL
jgi:nucleotide-binding universal stress UspA family protein